MKLPAEPVTVDGQLRPDLDNRWVPRATMALYCEVSGDTVRLWTIAGRFPPDGVKKFGRDTRYRPSACMPLGVAP